MTSGDYLVWFFLINGIGLFVSIVEIGLNLRNWVLLTFYNLKKENLPSDLNATKLNQELRFNLEKEFHISFQAIFELFEALTFGYVLMNFLTNLRYAAAFTFDSLMFKRSVLLLVIVLVFIGTNYWLIKRDTKINHAILDYYDKYRNKKEY